MRREYRKTIHTGFAPFSRMLFDRVQLILRIQTIRQGRDVAVMRIRWSHRY